MAAAYRPPVVAESDTAALAALDAHKTDAAAHPVKANDSAVVHNTGAETIGGVKTFSLSPIVPTPTTAAQAATKAYADGIVGGATPDATTTTKGKLQLAGDLAGTADLPTVPGLAAKANDSAVVHNTGAETVAGVKTFSASPIVPTPTTASQAATKGYADSLAGTVTATEKTANHTLALADAGTVVEVNSAAALTVTVPPNSAVAFAVGTLCEIARMGAGTVTLVAGAGVTIRSRGGLRAIGNQYGSVALRKRATDEWVLVGDLA